MATVIKVAKAFQLLLLLIATATAISAASSGIYELESAFTLGFTNAVSKFHIEHALPLETQFQTPLDFQVSVQPPQKNSDLRFSQDNYGNRIAIFTIEPCSTNERVRVQMSSKVLVSPRSYKELPDKIPFPRRWPREAGEWLSPSFCVECTDPAFVALAKELRSDTTDVREVIRRCLRKSEAIRSPLDSYGPRYSNQTALYALRYRGVCTGNANLLAALLRSCGIPGRILGGAPTRSKSVATHFIVEAYIPGFGWYPLEPTLVEEGCEPSSQINWCTTSLAYEQEQKARWRSYIGGGVPYLSCNEIDLPWGTVRYVGGIDEQAGTDNRTRLFFEIESSQTNWSEIITMGRQHWHKVAAKLSSRDGKGVPSFEEFMSKLKRIGPLKPTGE